MDEIKITRRMLNNGMQGRIHVGEVDKFNKKVKEFNIKKEIPIKEKPIIKSLLMNEEIDSDFETMDILKEPTLRRVRKHGGFY